LLSAQPGDRAGIAVLGYTYVWAGVRIGDQGPEVVVAVRERDDQEERILLRVPTAASRATVALETDADARVRVGVLADDARLEVDPPYQATEGQWVGAGVSLFAAGRYGSEEALARFRGFDIAMGDA
ncbi:MAG TPA: hypothetical protein VN035_12145, partial [Microbacterium sp.]|nr:hypothetical protein [Microbacterium sp.]